LEISGKRVKFLLVNNFEVEVKPFYYSKIFVPYGECHVGAISSYQDFGKPPSPNKKIENFID